MYRKVTQTKKNINGDIVALCNPTEIWSPRKALDAIRDIENGINTYYVTVDNQKVDVIVATNNGNKYLRTDPDKTKENNLSYLPDC